jgi:hypothetical protein
MALLWLDGCDTYTAIADAAARYAGSNTAGMGISTTSGRFGGGCIHPGALSSASYLGPVTVPHTGANPIFVGGAIYPPTGNNAAMLVLYNSTAASNNQELTLYYGSGFFHLYRGPLITLVATASAGTTSGIWHHLECRATCADSGGTFELRIDGVTLINYTGDTRYSTTGTAGFDRVYFCSNNSALSGGAWDDLYVMDDTGSVANTWLGDCRVNTLAPTSDSAVQFTRSTGASNYLTLDEGRHNSDTDYVESATVGHIDKYGYADLAAAVATVYGLQVITWAKKTDATARTMRNKLYSGATTTDGSSYALLTTYAPFAQLTTLNPDGSVQWTPTTVNAALAGFEVVS